MVNCVLGQWIETYIEVDTLFLLAPKINRDEPILWNYMEEGKVLEIIWIEGVLSELFVILFGLFSFFLHKNLSISNSFRDKLLPSSEVNSSRKLASSLPFSGRILKPILLS